MMLNYSHLIPSCPERSLRHCRSSRPLPSSSAASCELEEGRGEEGRGGKRRGEEGCGRRREGRVGRGVGGEGKGGEERGGWYGRANSWSVSSTNTDDVKISI